MHGIMDIGEIALIVVEIGLNPNDKLKELVLLHIMHV